MGDGGAAGESLSCIEGRWDGSWKTLMRRQDDTLGVISGTLTNLASQAGLIGHEVNEQSE